VLRLAAAASTTPRLVPRRPPRLGRASIVRAQRPLGRLVRLERLAFLVGRASAVGLAHLARQVVRADPAWAVGRAHLEHPARLAAVASTTPRLDPRRLRRLGRAWTDRRALPPTVLARPARLACRAARARPVVRAADFFASTIVAVRLPAADAHHRARRGSSSTPRLAAPAVRPERPCRRRWARRQVEPPARAVRRAQRFERAVVRRLLRPRPRVSQRWRRQQQVSFQCGFVGPLRLARWPRIPRP
jgi:hypothetical protein